MKKLKIGFVGAGRMGSNMARRLHDLGYDVAVIHDHHLPVAEAIARELDAKAVEPLADVTAAADVIFTVVTDDKAMDEIFYGEDSLLVGAEGKLFINCATVSPESHEKAAAAAEKVGAKTLAASMASSITQAREGTLYLMVGGDEVVFSENEALLKDISASLKFVGPVGNAAKIKALVNMVMNINTAGLAEGLGLGDALGIDLDLLREVFSQTGANSRVLETDADDMVTRDHDCFFSAAHAAKDSGIANALAKAAGVKVPLSAATESQYRKLIGLDRGGLDKSAVSELTFKGRTED
ncbi:MAG: NAD(P)-dependent oxidoreductase [Akkermansiaceae bacterium]|jgi:3-hydroxyisobutyrate dehydrogenase|nr:NAD(P)-dependent oxidoreductase [Akkermansiaceae bacterium]MDP4646412.1 NAD(P)-dependent oxidoreductase [Akkermansiaceae bacterium]MDP4780015.1 NAD(P)-dependent oxidoreductase [Akkermansiaceae bacterium]MDP4897236.1 NAD(P)-dependent oxidoreductase [Akkermansiaceae bacterium]MDP4995412.1 NAD(P)-dependent oxidoreductase [Akkermansiaceae bacterium]